MGAEDHLCTVVDQLLDRRQSCHDTGLVSDLTIFKRYIKVASYKYALSRCMNIVYGFLI